PDSRRDRRSLQGLLSNGEPRMGVGAGLALPRDEQSISVVMTTERWRQIEWLFHAALKYDANRRAELLGSAFAGHDGLVREVNSLLIARDKAQGFIAENALQAFAREIAAENAESIATETVDHDFQNATTELFAGETLPRSYALNPGAMLGERYLIERKIGHG